MKKIFIYITLFFAASIFVKCGKEEGIIYTYYIETSEENAEDLAKIENYLKPKKLAKTNVLYGNVKDTDLQAIELFNEMVLKISITELNALNLKPASAFTYAVSRWKDPHNPYSGTVILESFTYP